MRKADLSDRICKWSLELANFDIRYEPRTAIKGQALADFVAELTPKLESDLQKENAAEDADAEKPGGAATTPERSGLVRRRSPPRAATIYTGESCIERGRKKESQSASLPFSDCCIGQSKVCCMISAFSQIFL
ncbi:hypothetical protein Vadar_003351 [Vaccinium darrowii]|uniref:Uncharacterized protein n=1 Tax=Vaccinium darrowii TaxID=229202 RepID=A0ACB7X7Q8_9ERIC|nr:hypothetical protein Vadar_003351 [Vaccinium darrowii]